MLMTCRYPEWVVLLIVRASRENLACENTRFSLLFADVFAGYRNLLKPMSSSNQIWVVTRLQ